MFLTRVLVSLWRDVVQLIRRSYFERDLDSEAGNDPRFQAQLMWPKVKMAGGMPRKGYGEDGSCKQGEGGSNFRRAGYANYTRGPPVTCGIANAYASRPHEAALDITADSRPHSSPPSHPRPTMSKQFQFKLVLLGKYRSKHDLRLPYLTLGAQVNRRWASQGIACVYLVSSSVLTIL